MSLDIHFSDVKKIDPQAIYTDDFLIERISTDTRSLLRGDTYVAIKGPRFDGHDYITDAISRGASSAVVSQADVTADAPMLKVDDTVVALGNIAAIYRNKLGATVIGITGSNGKTTVKGMLASIGEVHGRVAATRANENNKIGVPLTLLSVNKEDDLAVIEMGTSEQGEIAYLTRIVSPDISVLTNISESHMAGLGSLDGIFQEKSDIIRFTKDSGVIVLNADHPYSDKLLKIAAPREVIFYGLSGSSDVRGVFEQRSDGYRVRAKCPDFDIAYTLQVPGEHNALNSLAAVAVSIKAGIDRRSIVEGLENFSGIDGRLTINMLNNAVRLIDDSYNANPASTRQAIKVLAAFPGRKIMVFGGMAELGEQADELHRDIGRRAMQSGVDELYVLESARKSLDEFDGVKHCYEDIDDLCNALAGNISEGDSILVKGSRRYATDRVVKSLKAGL